MSHQSLLVTLDFRPWYAPAEHSSCGYRIRECQSDLAVVKTHLHFTGLVVVPEDRPRTAQKIVRGRSSMFLDKLFYISVVECLSKVPKGTVNILPPPRPRLTYGAAVR